MSAAPNGAGYTLDVTEAHLELTQIRCPRCAADLILRVTAQERAGLVHLELDTACIACGVSPWSEPDQRLIVFRPGAPLGAALAGAASDFAGLFAAAQGRVDSLLRRCEVLERELASANGSVSRASADERRRSTGVESDLRGEISRLEGSLAEARLEVRRAEEATRGAVETGKRAIEMD